MSTEPDVELRQTPASTKVARKPSRQMNPVRVFVDKDRLAFFWFIVAVLAVGCALVTPFFLVQKFKERERVVVIDPAHTYYVSSLLSFEEAKELHAQQTTLAATAFLERNPNGFDSPELLKRLVMHEGHTIYRVETTPHWNLSPDLPVTIPIGPVRAGISSKAASPVNDELVMEINRQKAATKTLIQGTTAVSSKLDELSQSVEKTQQIVRETQELKQQVDTTSQRMEALEQELRRRAQPPSPATSNTPAEDNSNW